MFGRWFRREYKLEPVSYPVSKDHDEPVRAVLGVDFGRTNEFYANVREKMLQGRDHIVFELDFPEDFPQDALLYFFGKDWDDQWYNYAVELPKPCAGRQQFVLPLTGPKAEESWVPGKHFRSWHQMTPIWLDEIGLKFDSPKGKTLDWKGEVLLRDIRTRSNGKREKKIRNFRMQPAEPKVGELLEISFELTHEYTDPFDRKNVDIAGEVILPDGESKIIRAFYFEDFVLDGKDEYAKQVALGHPQFRWRFTPRQEGEHAILVAGRIGGQRIELPEIMIKVKPGDPNWKGFIERMPDDDRFLQYSETGEEFWGQGLNVRSPFDTRYNDMFPFTEWEPYNLNMYKRLFEKYEEAGINVVEIWMSSWWLALEWIPDKAQPAHNSEHPPLRPNPGCHGVGHMNQWRAWKLDKILQWAEEHNIYVILAVHNHGKFSTWCDDEWEYNPFNVRNGGYLRRPDEFFSNSRAFEDFRKLADYIVARWSYSPQILTWKLFTEINLTGSRGGSYLNYNVARWHKNAARHLKLFDPNKHLVTTHWSTDYKVAQKNPALAQARELDLLTLDAYYSGHKGCSKLYTNLQGTLDFQDSVKKPFIITEFGGTPTADHLPHIYQQLHVALWEGFVGGFAATPCLWWFPLVEEMKLYNEYKAVANFAKGEARKGLKRTKGDATDGLRCSELRSSDKILAWIFDPEYFFENNRLYFPGKRKEGATYTLQGLNPGKYSVEFWNCQAGEAIHTATVTVSGETMNLLLPSFRRDIALKVKLLKPTDD